MLVGFVISFFIQQVPENWYNSSSGYYLLDVPILDIFGSFPPLVTDFSVSSDIFPFSFMLLI